MNANSINGTHTPEKQMLELFRGACLGVRAMHDYRASSSSSAPSSLNPNPSGPSMSRSRSPMPDHEDNDHHESHGLLNNPSSSNRREDHDHDHDEDDEEEGYSYPQGASIPQVIDKVASSGNDVVFDGDEETKREQGSGTGELVPYAHRDIKPAYVFPSSWTGLVQK